MTASSFDSVLAQLRSVKPSGKGYTALRPAHDDQRKSLSVSLTADGKILFYCHAGCKVESIANALGLSMCNLFADGKPSARIVATYDYTDERGALLFQTVRYDPKEFCQRRPDGSGGWLWSLNGVRRVLYRLPALLTANPNEPVFVVEGEKDADKLARLGLIATTNPMGALKWCEEYSECLRGRHVVIVPDNDSTGIKHARQVAQSAYPLAKSVKILDLPGLLSKGDVSDWLDAGGDKASLFELAANAPLYRGEAPEELPKKSSGPSRDDWLTIDDCPTLPDSARLPDDIDTAHQWLDTYIAFSRKWSPRSFEDYHEACGLWLLSTIAARRIKSDLGKERFTNLYIGLVGRTTHWVKSGAADIGKEVLKQVGLSYFLLPDELTPQSFVNTMTVRLPEGYENLSADRQELTRLKLAFAGQRGWWYDEFGRHLHKMMNDQGVYAEFRGLLRQLDNCPFDYTSLTIGRGTDTIERPYLALLASLTPSDMRPFARRGADLWNDGYFARFAFVASPSSNNPSRARYPSGQRIIPVDIIKPLHEWHERLGTPNVTIEDEIDLATQKATGKKRVSVSSFETETVALPDGVRDRFYFYHDGLLEIAAASGCDDVDGNYGRFAEKAFRIALLLASVEGASQIQFRHWARAQQITERWRAGLHNLIGQLNQPEPSEAVEIEERIYATVQKIGEATPVQVGYYNKNLSSVQITIAMEGMATAGRLNRVRQTKKKTWIYAPA